MNWVKQLAEGVKKRDFRSLAKAITLVESTLPTDRKLAEDLLSLLPSENKTIRIGISGIPGVGKSTFIEKLGAQFLQNQPNSKIAVLSIDPSSPLEGGSILADKLRMVELAKSRRVFIRPSPNLGSHGGLSPRARESLLLLEAAEFDFVFVETVGVGQAEYHVASLVDMFILLQMPSTGDEWQVLKKGIPELADLIVINKADGELKQEALKLKQIFETSYGYHNDGHGTQVLTCSAKQNEGLAEIFLKIQEFISEQKDRNLFLQRRKKQNIFWFEENLALSFKEEIATNKGLSKKLAPFRKQVEDSGPSALTAIVDKCLTELLGPR